MTADAHANTETDQDFYDRADAVIQISNVQSSAGTPIGKVSASTLYAASRFNAWVMACNHGSAQGMAQSKQETLDYFTQQYRAMLEENLNDYIENYSQYMHRQKAPPTTDA